VAIKNVTIVVMAATAIQGVTGEAAASGFLSVSIATFWN
jgi:hypothetical protein